MKHFSFAAALFLGSLITFPAAVEAELLLRYSKALTGQAEVEVQVVPDIAMLDTGPAELSVPLPSGDLITFERDFLERRDNGLLWVGSSDRNEQIVITLEQGLIFSVIESSEGNFHLIPKGQDQGHILQTPLFKNDVETYCKTSHSAPLEITPTARNEANPLKAANQIDVLVVYTSAARQRYGISGMVGWARSSIDLNNTAFRNSQMPARLRLVGVRQVSYQETAGNENVLSWMRGSQQVKSLRNEVGADIVGMLIQNSNFCGVAATIPSGNIASFSESMLQVTAINCISGQTFSHEIGHLIGMEHDPANGRAQNFASFPWSYGHYVDGHFRTVMSYRSECQNGCPRRSYFSSPTLRFEGVATGIAGARDNRRTGNAITPTIARFRSPVQGMPPEAPSLLTPSNRSAFHVDLTWTDNSSNEASFEIERADGDIATFRHIATVTTDSEAYGDNTVEPLTTYRYRVRATNGFGASAYTPEEQITTPAPDLSTCEANDTSVCLLGGRFEATVSWLDFSGNTGVGHVLAGNSDLSAIFWFFDAQNWEMMVKMIDACSFNDRFWVFAAATTNVGYQLNVRDTETGATKVYVNDLGTSSPAITDNDALPCL